MEDILFDVHLAEATIDQDYTVFNNNDSNKWEIFNAVYQKHNISREQFDTSVVWYAAHLNKYMKIYESLGKRYSDLSDTLSIQIEREKNIIVEDSNLVNIWALPSVCSLSSPDQMRNILTFKLDTITFNKGDIYELRFNVLGFDGSITPWVELGIKQSDSILVNRTNINSNGAFSITIVPQYDKAAKEVFGWIYIPQGGIKTQTQFVLNEIKLYQRKSSSPIMKEPVMQRADMIK